MVYTKILEVSSCTNYDMALIKGSWYYSTNEEFRCETYFAKLGTRADSEVVISKERERRGCGIFQSKPKVQTEDGLRFFSCLCHPNFHHPNFNQLIFLQEAFKRGTLPFAGSLCDQPAQILEIFSLLEQLQSEREIENQKKLEAETKKAQQSKKNPRKR